MPKYHVTLNEIIAKTYKVEAENADDAIQAAKDLADPDDHLVCEDWIDYWGDDGVAEITP